MAAHSTTRTRLKKELFKKKEEEKTVEKPEGKEEPKQSETADKEETDKDKSDTINSKPESAKDSHLASSEQEKETAGEVSTDENPSNKPTLQKRLLWVGLLVIYIAILALGGYFMYQLGFNKGGEAVKKQIEKSQQEAKAKEPTPTVTPEIDKTKYKIKVLNGSGVSGEAARAKDLLEGDGFTLLSIGNASSQDNTDTTIASKDTVDNEFVNALKETLEKTYTLGEVKTLTSNDTSDVVVTLGGVK